MIFLTTNLFNRYLTTIDWDKVMEETISKAISLVILFIIFWVLKRMIHGFVTRLLAPSMKLSNQDIGRQKTIIRLLENLLNYALYFLLFYWILAILGLPVSSLLAGAGIAGAAIGLGAQGFLTDLVNGFFILFERQFDVGDNVKLSNGSITVEGIVSVIGIRTTQVKGHDGVLYFVPNRNITLVSNLSRGEYRVFVDLPIKPTEDLSKVEEILQDVNRKDGASFPELTQAPELLGPQTSKNGQFSYRVILFVKSGSDAKLYHRFYKLYQAALLDAGLELQTQGTKNQ